MNSVVGHIYLVDDDASVRSSLQRMLEHLGYTVEAYDGPRAFLENSVPISPAIVLLDMRMPDMTGLELQAKMQSVGRTTPIIFISGESQTQEVIDAFKAGAIDFLLKPFNMNDLLRAIHQALELDRQQFTHYRKTIHIQLRYESLTPREREVCAMVVGGAMNKDIAEHFNCSLKTIKVHRSRVMAKMGVESLMELVDAVRALGDAVTTPTPIHKETHHQDLSTPDHEFAT